MKISIRGVMAAVMSAATLSAAPVGDATDLREAVRSLLDGVVREGFTSMVPRFSSRLRQQDGDQQLRRNLMTLAAVLGPMRAYEAQLPSSPSSTRSAESRP